MNNQRSNFVHENDPCLYLAHDLRAPLMSVKGLLDLMRNESGRENLEYYFGLLEQSVDNMNQSITDILTKLKNERVEMQPQEVDFKKIAEEAIQSLHYMAGAESLKIILAVDEHGPFFSDHNSLFSIFSNLLSNAIRYRDKNKDSFLKIDVTVTRKGAMAIFQDNGIGIDEASHARVFDKFFRVNHEYGGSGLGLTIVKTSLDKIGGNIRIQSRIGEGTTFFLQIPNLLF